MVRARARVRVRACVRAGAGVTVGKDGGFDGEAEETSSSSSVR
jgi:hypothetical protein